MTHHEYVPRIVKDPALDSVRDFDYILVVDFGSVNEAENPSFQAFNNPT